MKRRDGFALVAALWFTVLLSAVALDFALVARDLRTTTLNGRDHTLARAAAEAGVEHARALLRGTLTAELRKAQQSTDQKATPMNPWRHLDQFQADTVALGNQRYTVQLIDAGSQLNVNTANEAELRRFFVALRIDGRRADSLAQVITDWKDADVSHRARGAEASDYVAAGVPILPSNVPFRDVRELRWVLGMTNAVYERIAPFLTTIGSGRVNLRSAERAVLLALPGMTDEAVAAILRLRRDPRRPLTPDVVQQTLSSSARAAMLSHLPELSSRTVSTTSEVEVRSVGWTQSGVVRVEVSALVVRADDEILTSARRVR